MWSYYTSYTLLNQIAAYFKLCELLMDLKAFKRLLIENIEKELLKLELKTEQDVNALKKKFSIYFEKNNKQIKEMTDLDSRKDLIETQFPHRLHFFNYKLLRNEVEEEFTNISFMERGLDRKEVDSADDESFDTKSDVCNGLLIGKVDFASLCNKDESNTIIMRNCIVENNQKSYFIKKVFFEIEKTFKY